VWGLVGALTALAILWLTAAANIVPLLLTSVLFAEVVGFTALLSRPAGVPLLHPAIGRRTRSSGWQIMIDLVHAASAGRFDRDPVHARTALQLGESQAECR
jgi:hypothetical protein